MSTVNKIDDNVIMFTKGAPDVVFSRCKYALNDGELVPITDEILNEYKKANEDFSNKALRVLAFATKNIEDENFVPEIEVVVEFNLVGFMSFIDAP